MNSYEVFILAGGLGTRLRSVVKDVPKPMAEVQGEPFLAHLMRYWVGQGIGRITLSVGYLGDQIRDFFGDSFQGVPISYAIEKERLGTGGAVLAYLRKRKDVCPAGLFIVNGDTFFPINVNEMLASCERSGAGLCIAAFRSVDSARYDKLIVDENLQLVSIGARQQPSGPKMNKETIFLANGGVYFLRDDLLDLNHYPSGPTSLEEAIIPQIAAESRGVHVLENKVPFIDIGVPEDYSMAQGFNFSCD